MVFIQLSYNQRKGKAIIFASGDLFSFALQYVPTLQKCLASSAYYLDKNIQLHEIIEYIYSSVYGDILNTSEKQQCLEGVVLEGSASIGFRHPDHTNPLILLILEIKGLPHITK